MADRNTEVVEVKTRIRVKRDGEFVEAATVNATLRIDTTKLSRSELISAACDNGFVVKAATRYRAAIAKAWADDKPIAPIVAKWTHIGLDAKDLMSPPAKPRDDAKDVASMKRMLAQGNADLLEATLKALGYTKS